MLLRVENLSRKFGGLLAVNNLSFSLARGEILAIIGPNGAGKTTVFNLISGMLRPTSGQIYLDGKPLGGLKPYQVARMGVARTFQTTALFDQLRVIDNLDIAYKLRTRSGLWGAVFRPPSWKRERERALAKAKEVLEFTGLGEKAYHHVSMLSQEEQKRLAIGVALATAPQLILLDEPASGLIQEETEGIALLIKKLRAAGITVCVIEHKMRMVMNLADRVIVLNYGNKIAEGKPEEIVANQKVIEAYLGGESVA